MEKKNKENKGTELTLPTRMNMAKETKKMETFGKYILMESHVWKPPWLSVGKSRTWKRVNDDRSGSMKDEQIFGNVVERDKRKPPWLKVETE